MGVFDFRKKDRIVDLSDTYKQFSNEETGEIDFQSIEDKRKKLAKRISDMADKLDEISNALYHLTQRVEVVEKKVKLNLGN